MKTYITVSIVSDPVRIPSQAGRQPYTAFNAMSYEGKKPRPLQVRVWGNCGRNLLVSVGRGQTVTLMCEEKPAFHEREDAVTGRITRIEVARASDVLLPLSRCSCVVAPSIREDTDPLFLAVLPSASVSGASVARAAVQEHSEAATGSGSSAITAGATSATSELF